MSAAPLLVARDVAALRAQVRDWRKQGLSVALVPTMGALHEGHLSLVRAAKAKCDRAVASLFVNPKQFAPHEDFERYPRDETGDAAMLASAGCDLLFAPERASMYPEGFSTSVLVTNVSTPLEGEFRPHFFGGVATVVAKLFTQVRPDMAFFGEKDFQQLKVVTRMARDLDLGVKIIGGTIIRERDGLAMSSRNVYLSPDERRTAPVLFRTLKEASKRMRAGDDFRTVLTDGAALISKAGFALDYLEARHAETLAPISSFNEGPVRLLVAAKIGTTRLIDNIKA